MIPVPERFEISLTFSDYNNWILADHIPHMDTPGNPFTEYYFNITIPDIDWSVQRLFLSHFDSPQCSLQLISVMTDKIVAGIP
jgi:hypothetical protein